MKKSWLSAGKMKKFPENDGIKMARNGKNQNGSAGPPARIRVGFARVEVVLARVGVGTGQEIWPFFSTKRLDWGKFRAMEGRLAGVSTALGLVLRGFVENAFHNTLF